MSERTADEDVGIGKQARTAGLRVWRVSPQLRRPMSFAVLIPCGPNPRELERLPDTIDSLLHYEPGCERVLVLNDGNPGLAKLALPAVCEVMEHPRRGAGWGWGGGLLFGELWAFERLQRELGSAGFILKLDTDALVIRPFARTLQALFANSGVGLAGSRIATDPLPPGKTTATFRYFARKVAKLRAPVGLWRKPRPHLRFALWGAHRYVAQLYGEAERNGYLPGELIEGGACAISVACVRALAGCGVLGRARDFLDVPVSDDIVLTMLPYLVGMKAVNSTAFLIEPATLRQSPDELLHDPDAAVIHSVKRYQQFSEEVIRACFRRRRNARSTPGQ